MKKLILFLIFFIGFAFKPFTCYASQFVVNPSDLQYIGEGFQNLQNLGVVDYGVVPVLPDSSDNSLNSVLSDFAKMNISTSISSSDFTVEDMPVDVMMNIASGEYVQSDGSSIPTNFSRLQYVSFDNGFYSGHALLYEGSIVYTVDSSENLRRVCDVKYGGSVLSSEQHKSLYSSFANQVKHDSYNYGGSVGMSATYYMIYGQTRSGVPAQVESVFISNQYIPGLIVPVSNSNGDSIQSWFTNDPNLIQHNVLMGWGNYSVTSGSYTKGNYTYSYRVDFASGIGVGGITVSNTLNDFLNGQTPYGGVFCFGRTGYFYSSSLYNDSVPFYPTDGDVISLDDPYAVDDVINFPLNLNPDINRGYDPTLETTADNYPISLDQDNSVTWDPTLSTPANPVPPTPEPQPTPEFDTSMVDIPFFTGLERRFPFCIPWDLKRAMQLLSVSPEPPSWDFTWTISVLNYDYSYHCVGDLSAFSGLADILRKLLFLSSFIGLAIFTYKHLF